ncbi:MAG: hypothetical protein ACRYG8_27455 [Janthinobacterium lividum]
MPDTGLPAAGVVNQTPGKSRKEATGPKIRSQQDIGSFKRVIRP